MSQSADKRIRIVRAAKEGRMDLAERLIKQMITDNDEQEITIALYEFSKRNNFDLVKLCLQDVKCLHKINFVPALTCAVRKGAWGIVDSILALKIDLDRRDCWGRTILMYSIRTQSFYFVAHLIKSGVDLEIKSLSGTVALHEAVATGNVILAEILLLHGARLDEFDGSGNSPLHMAITRQDEAMVALLLNYGADPNKGNRWEEYPLLDACGGPFAIWIMLLQHGANPDTALMDGWTALHALATGLQDDGVAKAESLIIMGADIDPVSRHQRTPLHVSIEHGKHQMARFFVENKADIERITWGLRTPLILATETHGGCEIMALLLEAEADPNVYNELGMTPVKIAYMIESEEKLELLLEYHAKPYDPWGNTKFFQKTPLPNRTGTIMIRHFAEGPYRGVYVDESDLHRLKTYHPQDYELYKQYREELLRMHQIPFYKNISYLEVYCGIAASPLTFCREAGFQEKIYEPIAHLFPLYYEDLRCVLEEEYLKARLWRYNEIELGKIFEEIFPSAVLNRIAYHTVTGI